MALCSDAKLDDGRTPPRASRPRPRSSTTRTSSGCYEALSWNEKCPRVGEAPFDSVPQNDVHRPPRERQDFVQYTKGAPDECCSSAAPAIWDEGKIVPITEEITRRTSRRQTKEMADQRAARARARRIAPLRRRPGGSRAPKRWSRISCFIGLARHDRPRAARRSKAAIRRMPRGRHPPDHDHRRPYRHRRRHRARARHSHGRYRAPSPARSSTR